jgi:hypothetical protein
MSWNVAPHSLVTIDQITRRHVLEDQKHLIRGHGKLILQFLRGSRKESTGVI